LAESYGDWWVETPATHGIIAGTGTEESTLVGEVTPDSAFDATALGVTALPVIPAYLTIKADLETPHETLLRPRRRGTSGWVGATTSSDDYAPREQNKAAVPDGQRFTFPRHRQAQQAHRQHVTAPSIASMASRAQGNTEATTTESQALARATIPYAEIRLEDILLGRGRNVYTRPGNSYYNDWLVPPYQALYEVANKIEKSEIAQALVHQATILEGRRFIKFNDDRTWSLAPLDEVLEKVQRSLRNK
jgi:hypothetical protein